METRKSIIMNYIIAEIKDDDTLKVLLTEIPENSISDMVDSSDYADKRLIAIPCKFIKVESTNYGYNTEVEIK